MRGRQKYTAEVVEALTARGRRKGISKDGIYGGIGEECEVVDDEEADVGAVDGGCTDEAGEGGVYDDLDELVGAHEVCGFFFFFGRHGERGRDCEKVKT